MDNRRRGLKFNCVIHKYNNFKVNFKMEDFESKFKHSYGLFRIVKKCISDRLRRKKVGH